MPPAPTPVPPPKPGLLSREAVGVWFFGLGALGLLRAWMRTARHGAFEADAIGLLWWIGSALLAAAGALRIWRAVRRERG